MTAGRPRQAGWALGGLLAAILFAVLGALVVHASGVHRLDQWSVEHLMPGLSRQPGDLTFIGQATVKVGGRAHSVIRIAARVITEPASGWVSGVLLALLVAVTFRRHAPRAAALWAGGFGVSVVIELALKGALTRPPLLLRTDLGYVHVAGFDSSYPSGHADRAFLLAAFAAALWPRVRVACATWLGAVAVLLVLGGFHTPTDVAGGLLLGTAIVCALRALGRLSEVPRAAPAVGAASERSVMDRARSERTA